MMLGRRTAAAGAVRPVAEYALARGVTRDVLGREIGVPDARLDDPDRRVSIDGFFSLWTYLGKLLGDAALPIRVAEQATLEDLHVLGFTVMTAPSLGEGLRAFVRYQSLLSTSGVWEVIPSPRSVAIRRRRGAATALGQRLANESAVAQFIGGLRRVAGAGLDPLEVTFRHRAPPSAAAHAAFFRCRVAFGASEDGMVVARDVLDSVSPWANAGLWRYVCSEAEARVHALAPRPLVDVVLAHMGRELGGAGGAIPSVEAVAASLGTTERTLRRRLRAEGTSYRALADRARRECVREVLRGDGASVLDAAFRAGFSGASALTHACRRWFECGPRELRKRLRGGAAAFDLEDRRVRAGHR
jgi:AraC-like DNA-binding protein